MKKFEKIFKALANERRLKILAYLRGKKAVSVVSISEATKFSYKATSKHLGILYHADLVDRRQASYEMVYFIHSEIDPIFSNLIKSL